MTSHALYRALEASKTAFGAWITLPGAHNARIVAQSSPHLSWVMIDCEHGLTPLSAGSAEIIQAITGIGFSDVSPLVRIPATGTCSSTSWMIKYALDAGARGILVPMVSNPEKAKEIVSDCRFPPAGRRGFGNPLTHLAWNVSVVDYLNFANNFITIMVQIENKEGVENVEGIAAVDGLDVLFIGPYDLSLNLGYPPPFPDVHPEVEKVIQAILEVTHRKGKKCGIFCSSGTQAFQRAQQGFDMINVTSDSGAMSEAIASNLKAAVGQNV
ncbi:Pyruvate/Phosphoenolpyruvate kinase-like domain-containing protein [Pisolithus marmoratus]|nr:Pyruvate/Phosphoenolpyruvate kinase-like domain-containing protein [Pisolithus marmoratus]